jgi:uncharacterized membrane protein
MSEKNYTIIVVVVSLLFSSIFGIFIADSTQRSGVDAVVIEKMIQQNISKDGTTFRYLINTDNGTFTSKENILVGKFESSETYFKLKEGTKYHFVLVGFGKTLVTDYKNIIKAEETK